MPDQRPYRGPLLLLIGAPGAGKSTWARSHFPPAAVVSTDKLRALVSGDPSNQAATPAAIRVMNAVAEGRLQHGLPTVVDATNAVPDHREELLNMGYRWECPPVAVVFDIPLDVCLARNARRGRRRVPEEFVRATHAAIRAELPVERSWIPAGFMAGLWVIHDGPDRVGGHLPREYREQSWLAAARKPYFDPRYMTFHHAGAALRTGSTTENGDPR